MPPPEKVLICALSGRALAQGARAAGMTPIVLDAFGDLDTREASDGWRRLPVDGRWRLHKGALLAAAQRLAPPPIPLVWGSGFERLAGLLAEVSVGRELLGNPAFLVRAIKEPRDFAASAAMLGIAHPEVRFTPPKQGSGWLCKRMGGAGGGHVRRTGARSPSGRGWYWQRWNHGEPVSALVLGNGENVSVLAIGRQLTASLPGRPYRFGGVVAPAAISETARQRLEQAARRLGEHYRIRGLASVDALVAGDRVAVLELNPRPGGSLDAYGAALGVNLVALHVDACRGRALPEPIVAAQCAGSLVAYADRATSIPDGFDWPDWAADRSPRGSAIPAGGPICTVLAQGSELAPVLDLLRARVHLVRFLLRAQALTCGKPPLRYDRQVMSFPQAA